MNFTKIIIPVCLASLLTTPAFARKKAIYGLDDRKEAAQSRQFKVKQFAPAIAGRVDKGLLYESNDPRYYSFDAHDIIYYYYVNSTSNYTFQNSLPKCTGFLVAPGILMTAGHCIKDQNDCDNFYWAFDYDDQTAESTKIAKKNVTTCKRIIKSAQSNFFSKKDYAIIELNWNPELNKRRPVRLQHSEVELGTPIAIMGHPLGLPLKIADNAKIEKIKKHSFISHVDSFGGNSGSPVFNALTGEVIGIQIKGASDFKYGDFGFDYARYDERDPEHYETSLKITSTPIFEILNGSRR